jgi:nickel transport protein
VKTTKIFYKNKLLKPFLVITAIWIMAHPISAWAHKVTVFAWAEGNTIFTESKFSGGKRVTGGIIEVYAPDGRKLIEGKTNATGEYSFKIPQKTDLEIVLKAGMGHRGEWTLRRDEIEDSSAFGADTNVTGQPADSREKSARLPVQVNPVTGYADIEARLEKVLDKKLKPLISRLNQIKRQEDGPALTDILGGLGYILGLVGIAAYVHSRRRGK